MNDYIKLLENDLLEQFKDKEKISGLLKVIGKQFNDVRKFYEQLKTERDIYTSVGKQLDGVGDIVVLARSEAGEMMGNNELPKSLDDETYRRYLIFKVLKNTCNCTYYEIMTAINMFWPGPPLKYKEDPNLPATIQFEFDAFKEMDESALGIPFVRPGGVGLKLRMNKTDESVIYVGFARRELATLSVDCNVPVLESVTYFTDETGTILTDENGAWLIE